MKQAIAKTSKAKERHKYPLVNKSNISYFLILSPDIGDFGDQ